MIKNGLVRWNPWHRRVDARSTIQTYLRACELEGKTVRTIGAYRESLGQFTSICESRGLPSDITRFCANDVYEFLAGVQERGVSLGTQHRRFRESRAFFSWCLRMGLVERNPFSEIPNVKPEMKIIKPFTVSEITTVLDACDPHTEFGVRNRAIMFLLLDTGLRRSELEMLEILDIDFDTKRIHVRHGKGRKQRVVPFSEKPKVALQTYLDKYRGHDPGRVFLTVDRGSGRLVFNSTHLGTLFQRMSHEIGIHVYAHRFRHTFCTWAIQAGAREIDVQYLLGHSSNLMVRRYSASYDASQAANNHVHFSPAAAL